MKQSFPLQKFQTFSLFFICCGGYDSNDKYKQLMENLKLMLKCVCSGHMKIIISWMISWIMSWIPGNSIRLSDDLVFWYNLMRFNFTSDQDLFCFYLDSSDTLSRIRVHLRTCCCHWLRRSSRHCWNSDGRVYRTKNLG